MRRLLIAAVFWVCASPATARTLENDVPISMEETYDQRIYNLLAQFNWVTMFTRGPISRLPAVFPGGRLLINHRARLDDNFLLLNPKRVKWTIERCGIWPNDPLCVSSVYVLTPTQFNPVQRILPHSQK